MGESKGNILVVDDEMVVLKSCERILSPEGYDITTVGSSSHSSVNVAKRISS